MKTRFTPLATPERMSRYVLFHEVSRGGMGTVYLARSRSRGGYQRVVALKRLHTHLAGDDRFRRMFLDEVRLVMQLDHPNTGAALDFGEEGGTAWLTMPFVVGESLDHVMAALGGAGPEIRARVPELTARILIDACEGLHAAHEMRDRNGKLLEVVHRDVTPRNVIVGYDGVTRVIDFGIATALHRLHQTATGELKGTAGYAAPEHVQGKPQDRRADVWSLGVLGWEMCTGRRLFDGEEPVAVLERVLSAPIEGPRELVPSVPLGLDETLVKALNRAPQRRHATARDMARELELFLSEHGKPSGAPEVADCMEALFPGEHAARRRVLSEVRAQELPSKPSSRRKKPASARPWPLLLAATLGGAATYVAMRLFG